jgi:hypothetical protein
VRLLLVRLEPNKRQIGSLGRLGRQGRTFTHEPCFDLPGHLHPVRCEDIVYLRDETCADASEWPSGDAYWLLWYTPIRCRSAILFGEPLL